MMSPMPKRANNSIPRKMKIHNSPHINLFSSKSYRLSMKKGKKLAYLFFIGGLTCSTISACQWQTRKYLAAVQRWDTIKRELSLDIPQSLSETDLDSLYPFKYVALSGRLSEEHVKVDRTKDGRMGYLVVRGLTYLNKNGENQQITALQGWCEKDYEVKPLKGKTIEARGILRARQKKDYVHEQFKKQELEKFNISTYIDLDLIRSRLNIKSTPINQQYFFEMLRPLDSVDHDSFPYQYSVDNFELPYLTPDKHLSYATFWGGATLIGLLTIFKVWRFK